MEDFGDFAYNNGSVLFDHCQELHVTLLNDCERNLLQSYADVTKPGLNGYFHG